MKERQRDFAVVKSAADSRAPTFELSNLRTSEATPRSCSPPTCEIDHRTEQCESDGRQHHPQWAERHGVVRARPKNQRTLQRDQRPAPPQQTLDLRTPRARFLHAHVMNERVLMVRPGFVAPKIEEISEHRARTIEACVIEERGTSAFSAIPAPPAVWATDLIQREGCG